MSIKSKLNKATKGTELLEKEFIKNVEKNYKLAAKSIKKDLDKAFLKFNVDGKWNWNEMQKYNRMNSLLKQVETELKVLSQSKVTNIKKYLTDVYELNYYATGWALETEGQIKLSYSVLDRRKIANSVLSPLDKIALQNNAVAATQGIRSAITTSIVKGDSIQQMSKGISKALGKNANDAVRIARTETTQIMGKSRLESMDHASGRGLELAKEWVATNDDRTRDSHNDIDGEVVATNMPFSNGLMYPGDQSTGDPGETINCRCTMVTVIKGYPSNEALDRAKNGDVIEDQNLAGWINDRVKNNK